MIQSHHVMISVLAAVLLAACAGSSKTVSEGSQEQKKAEAAHEVKKAEAPYEEKKKEPEFEQVVTVLKPIGKVPISVTYQGGAFYHLEVNNSLPTVINLVWDESAYVNTKGESVRILHVQKKSDISRDPPAQQASPPIAPDSQFQADFIGESWLDFARRGATPQPKDGLRKAKIYLSFNIKGKRVDWMGEITFVPVKRQ